MQRTHHQEYIHRDVPIKCSECRAWMRRHPTGKERRPYVLRARIPFAHVCQWCLDRVRDQERVTNPPKPITAST